MQFNLLKSTVLTAVAFTLSAAIPASETPKSVTVKKPVAPSVIQQDSQTIATFCLDPIGTSSACIPISSDEVNQCIDFGFDPVNGISGFAPTDGIFVSCLMFTEEGCQGDNWFTGFALPNFSLLAFNGTSPDNNIFSTICELD